MGKISVFVPNIKGTGSKFCSAMTAFQINKVQPLSKILIIDMNPDGSYFLSRFFHNDAFHTFENFFNQRRITGDTLKAIEISKIPLKQNIDLLKSAIPYSSNIPVYSSFDISEMLMELKQMYEHIILIASQKTDSISIASISMSDNVFLIVNDNFENFANIRYKIEEISSLKGLKTNAYCIFNKFAFNFPPSDIGKLIKDNGFKIIAMIPYGNMYVDNQNVYKMFGEKTEIKKANLIIAQTKEFNKRELRKIEIRERLGLDVSTKDVASFSEKSIRLMKKNKGDGIREAFEYIYYNVFEDEDYMKKESFFSKLFKKKSKKEIKPIKQKKEKKSKTNKKTKEQEKDISKVLDIPLNNETPLIEKPSFNELVKNLEDDIEIFEKEEVLEMIEDEKELEIEIEIDEDTDFVEINERL